MNLQTVTIVEADIADLERACETLIRAGDEEMWTRVAALALRFRAETGLRALPENVVPLERKVGR